MMKSTITTEYGNIVDYIPHDVLEELTLSDIRTALSIKQNKLAKDKELSQLSKVDSRLWHVLHMANDAIQMAEAERGEDYK